MKKGKESNNILLLEERGRNTIIPNDIEKLKIEFGNLQKSVVDEEMVISRINSEKSNIEDRNNIQSLKIYNLLMCTGRQKKRTSTEL